LKLASAAHRWLYWNLAARRRISMPLPAVAMASGAVSPMDLRKSVPSIRVLKGVNAGQSYTLSAPETLLGRDVSCGIVIPLQTISRHHARIVQEEGGVFIEDLRSRNGTLINGRRIESRHALRHGDRIDIHDVVMAYREDTNSSLQSLAGPPDSDEVEASLHRPAARGPRRTSVVSSIDLLAAGDHRLELDANIKLRAILEIIRSAGSSLDIDEVLSKVLDSLLRIFPQAARCYVLLAEGPEGRLTPRAIKHRAGAADDACTIGPVDTDIARQVMLQARAILSADLGDDNRAAIDESVLGECSGRSSMCAPLVAPSCDPSGVLQIDTDDVRCPFTQQDLEVVASLAGLVGQLIAFARWHERRRTEAALEREHAAIERERVRLRAVLNLLPVGVFIADAAGRLMETNPAAKALWGGATPLSESPEQYAEDYKAFWSDTGRRVESHEFGLSRALAAGEFCIGEEMEIEAPDGRRATILNSALPIRDPSGRIDGAVAVNVDITAHKAAEQSLKEADRRKDEFLAMLAHELRNPLAPIRNALGLLKSEGLDPPTVAWAMDMMERQVDHLVRLVDDLLDVSRATQGKIKLRKRRVDLNLVVAHAIETARPLIDLQQHELSVSLPGEPLWLECDEIRLTQVVANLLNNASKYTDRGGKIAIAGYRENGNAVLRMRDTGIGIAADVLPHVFDLFTQADRSLDRSHGGLGIGLCLVKKLVDLHGGTVEARSEGPGKGSEFVVRLPLAEAPAAAEAQDIAPQTAAPCRVLIVDDNLDAAATLGMIFRSWKHTVEIAHDGVTALEMATRQRPDIMLLDIGLPGIDGYEVARRLRAQSGFEEMLLVAVTGYGQDEDRRRSHDAGFDLHLVKPVDSAVLKNLVVEYDRRRREPAACAT
jgi:signal transduction histidine kinase/CheY-like chemotaxis protein